MGAAVKVSAVIMAHPRRRPFIAPLQYALGAKIPVVWDRYNDRWDTGRRALLAYDPDADYQLVVQDDAVPCLDLLAGIEKALEHVTDPLAPVGLYVGNVQPFRRHLQGGALSGAAWARMPQLNWGVAVAVPTGLISDLVEYCDDLGEPNYDLRISSFFEELDTPTWYTWPSLVDHKASPSLVPGRGSRRHAFQFIGRTSSANIVDWTGPVVDLDVRQEIKR